MPLTTLRSSNGLFDIEAISIYLEKLTRDGTLAWHVTSPRNLADLGIMEPGEMARAANFKGGNIFIIDHGQKSGRVVVKYFHKGKIGTAYDGEKSHLRFILAAAGFENRLTMDLDDWLHQSLV